MGCFSVPALENGHHFVSGQYSQVFPLAGAKGPGSGSQKVAEATWSKEAAKWDHLQHLRTSVVLGSATKRIKALNTPADIYVINRENVEWLVDYYKQAWPFDMVVLDESTSFKNSQSKRWKAMRRVRRFIKRMVLLTGTPSSKGLIDLWAQVYLLDCGERLGQSLSAYRERYFDPDQRSRTQIFPTRPKTVRRALCWMPFLTSASP